MGYSNLSACVADLERHGLLVKIETEVDAYLELAAIQRRAFVAKAPALLFTRVKGSNFPMLCNLYGTKERLNFIFRDAIDRLKYLFSLVSDPAEIWHNPLRFIKTLPALRHALPYRNKEAAVLEYSCQISDLPQLVSWSKDGGAFITLPLVYTEDLDKPGIFKSNLGMYRIQLSGNSYDQQNIGLHYQLQRGIGVHHAKALAKGKSLPVAVFVGGPPSLTLASIMPLPEGMAELLFAGLLGNQRIHLAKKANYPLPILADCDFCILGHIDPNKMLPEGPFGDHLGYYSLEHPFPVLQVEGVYHRSRAIWPFTVVGRPPQEDTLFGEFIHELTGPLIQKVFPGVKEVHAVDAAGVHPLLLALGSERYTPYENPRRPLELFTAALHLLGNTQTALAKYLLIAAHEDNLNLTTHKIEEFFQHILERTDFSRDLHFLTRFSTDTLDYTGNGFLQGSRLIWSAAGNKKRKLATEISNFPDLPAGFSNPKVVMPGILAISANKHNLPQNQSDLELEKLANILGQWQLAEQFPLVIIADSSDFVAENLNNFLWVTFTRSDPANDLYGAKARIENKHWLCQAPLLIDARKKAFHAPELEEDLEVVRKVEALAAKGGPLHGII